MNPRSIQILSFILLVISALSMQNCNGPKKVNWNPTFDSKDKIPFGTYICKNQMQVLFPDSDIEIIDNKLGSFIQEYYPEGAITFFNTFINLDDDTEVLLDFIKEGNMYFESSLYSPLWDSLGIQYNGDFHSVDQLEKFAKDTLKKELELTDLFFSDTKYILDKCIMGNYFTHYPSEAEILGTVLIDGVKHPNFLRIPVEKGYYLVHCEPLVYTNIALLDNEIAAYTQDVFSYIPNVDIYWNNERIQQRRFQKKSEGSVPDVISYVWNYKSLRYGILVLVLAGLLYLIFNSVRRQKAVEYQKPYVNDLMDYSESLVNNYKNTINYKYLSHQRITYFLNIIREHYYFTHLQFNDKFAHQLHSKSKVPLQECFTLVNYINEINHKGFCSPQQFQKLSSLLDEFYIKSKLYGQPT